MMDANVTPMIPAAACAEAPAEISCAIGAGEVLFIANSSLASPTGGGRTRVVSEARQARRRGFTVSILCFVPLQQMLRSKNLLAEGKRKLASESDCRVIYMPRLSWTRWLPLYHLNDWLCGIVVWWICRRRGIRLTHGHGIKPSQFALLARRLNPQLKVVADIHGAAVAEAIYASKLPPTHPLIQTIARCENKVLRQADRLIFVSRAMQEYYAPQLAGRADQSAIIPCATDAVLASGACEAARVARLRREQGLSDKLVFCYAGSAASYQLVAEMCLLFRRILDRYPQAFWLILSHHQTAFTHKLVEAGVPAEAYRVMSVEHAEVFEWLQMGDIGFLLRDDSVVNRVASPTKFAEYGLCGLPVLVTGHIGDVSADVQRHQLGHLVDLQHLIVDDRLANFFDDVVRQRADYARRCAAFVQQHFSWNAYADALANLYRAPVTMDSSEYARR